VSALDGVSEHQPALARADAVSRRAAATGFDWDDPSGARAKVIEELTEVDAAASHAERTDEIGDLLFAIVNWARWIGVDPEPALHQATAKFERRFRAMEELAGDAFPTLSLGEMEALWQQVKRAG
jgi:nucleoside triphosphate diphosphatase